jgi:hypothetical protein
MKRIALLIAAAALSVAAASPASAVAAPGDGRPGRHGSGTARRKRGSAAAPQRACTQFSLPQGRRPGQLLLFRLLV